MMSAGEGERTILHVDMDSFFSAVEVRERPELKGLPVVVGADPKEGRGRGVVSTCSYEAREYGIRSGMPISRAYKLCPHAVFLPVNMALYRKVSARIARILRRYADRFQQVSIDEAFLDVSERVKGYGSVRELALSIKEEIKRREGLTCSIGVGPNKFVAKVASGLEKPDGLTIVEPDRVREFLAPLPVRKIPGVGRKTEMALRRMGIRTIGQLERCDAQVLVARFGKWGYRLSLLARGIDESEVEEARERKSVSREHTFEEDTDDPAVIDRTIRRMARELHRFLTSEGYLYRTVSVKVRFEDFETHTRSETLPSLTSDLAPIEEVPRGLLRGLLKGGRRVRLVGVRLSSLVRLGKGQRSMEEFLAASKPKTRRSSRRA